MRTHLLYKHLIVVILLFAFVVLPCVVFAQGCDPTTPTFTVNLTGRPDSIWTSTSVQRDGNCCGTTAPDKCIEFILTLDSSSNGIRLDIPTGALPGGALFYQIACGTSYQVGQDICLSGPGPHRITFCKPGNNVNTYQITAIPKPDLKGKLVINEACMGHLKAYGLVTSSITWESVPNNATHNTYLSCLTGCDSVSIIPSGNYPPTVTYRVCGAIAGGCGGATFCDTATVRFVSNIDVDIQPKNATVCFGGSTTSVTANPIGGLPPYSYLWNTNETTASINVGAGTYFVQMLDSLGCIVARDTVIVTSFASAIDAHAGNDTALCRNTAQALLRGTLQGGVGGIWKGGMGTFIPNDTTVNATYIPAASEITAGTVTLRLVTTRNGTCPPDSDEVTITINPNPVVTLAGSVSVCAGRTTSYNTKANAGNTYQWNVTGGTITSTVADTLINVLWGTAGTGSISIKQTNSSGCDSTRSLSITINPIPVVTLTGPVNVCAGRTTVYTTTANAGNTYQWNVTGGTITSTVADTLINVLWGAAGTGIVNIKQTSVSGCDSTRSLSITINPTPVVVLTGPANACAGKTVSYYTNANTGNTYQWNVTGGTILSTVADTLINVLWGTTGAGSVSIKQTSASGCDSTRALSFTINPTPAIVLNGAVNVCTGKTSSYYTNANTGNTYQWNVTGGTITSTIADTLIHVLWGAAGTGNVSIKQTNVLGCDSVRALSITINPTPAVTLNGPANVCAGKTTTYSTKHNVGNTYQWNVTGGTITLTVADTLIYVQWGAAGTGSVSIRQTNVQACDSLRVLNITINPTPAVTLNGPANVCAGKTTSHSTKHNAGNTYQWNITGGTITSTIADTLIYVQWGAAGTGSVSIRQTNVQGCDSLKTTGITINPTPAVAITGSSGTCAGKNYTYRITKQTGVTYTWLVNKGSIIQDNDSNIIVRWDSTGNGTVSVQGVNAFNCDSIFVLPVVITPTPIAVVSGSNDVCAYSQATYQAGGTNIARYKWTVINGAIQGADTNAAVTIKWGNQPAGSVTIRVISTAGCDSTTVFAVGIRPTPIPVILGPDSLCAFTQGSYHTSYTAGNTYAWQATGGNIVLINDTNVLVNWYSGTGANVQLKVTNALLCDSTVALPVRLFAKPRPVITGPPVLCEKQTGIYAVTKTSQVLSTTWTTSPGVVQAVNDTQVKITWSVAGLHRIYVKQVNNKGCDTTVFIDVLVNAKPYENIQGDNDVCRYAEKSWWVNAAPGYTYLWTAAGGTITGPNTDPLVRVRWDTTTGVLQLRLININGCDTVVRKIIQVKAAPAGYILGDTIACNNVLKYTYSADNDPDVNYFWRADTGEIIGSNVNNNVDVSWKSTGQQKIRLYVINTVTGCDSNLSRNVMVDSIIKPELSLSKSGGCIPFTLTFEPANIINADYNYTWNFGNGATSQKRKEDVSYTSAGVYETKLLVTNKNGCRDSTYTNIVANARPVAQPDYNQVAGRIYVIEDTIQFINRSEGGNLFIWKIISVKTDTAFETRSSFEHPGNYKVWLTAIDTLTGCLDSAEIGLRVWVRENVYVPNAFSPNGDGSNDFFSIGFENVVDFEVLIVNRWGEIIYRSTDPKFKWDGTYKNEKCQDDAYVYLVNARGYHGKPFSMKGTVTLMR